VAGDGDEAGLPPVTFFRPLKSGVPDLAAKLGALVRSARPGDQVLIGVEAGSPEAVAAEAVRLENPELEIAVVPCKPGGASNPKIAKILGMEPQARHEHWILSDSEAMIDAEFLTAFRREWTRCDVLTAGYRFRGMATWPQRLDAAAVLLGLWPGLAVLKAAGPLRLTLGACTGFRRADLQSVGGWAAFADDLAEDNRLGQALADAGRDIRLCSHVVTLECDALSWPDYWRHQRRVAVTYRAANPAGFAGALLTQGVTTSFLLACWQITDLWAWSLCAAVFAARCVTAHRASRVLDFSIPGLVPVVFVASVVETICWALSWGTKRVWWSGKYRRISFRGRLFNA
jgi:ceramide glucosyltransferase